MASRKKVSIVKTREVEIRILFVPDRHYLGAAGVAPRPFDYSQHFKTKIRAIRSQPARTSPHAAPLPTARQAETQNAPVTRHLLKVRWLSMSAQ